MTKTVLTLMLLLLSVGGAQAGKLYADLSKLANGPVSQWDGSTNTMTWTATSNNMISNFSFASGNYSNYSTISITVSNLNNAAGIRLQIKANGQEKLVALNGNGSFTKKLTDDFGFTLADLASVEWIRVLGSAWQNGENHTINADNPASATISDVYLEQPTKSLDVDLSKMAASEGTATWDKETGKFSWTGTWSNAITLPGLSGNLSAYTTINYSTEAGSCDHFRILIYYSNGAGQTTYQASVGNKSVTFSEMGVDLANLTAVSSIKISGASDVTGDITLKSFGLEGPLVNYIEATSVYAAPTGTDDLNGMIGAGNFKWSINYPATVANETSLGGNIDGDNQSLDIENYDYLHFVVSAASADAHTGLRVFVWDGSARQCLYPHPISECANVTDWKATTWITEPGTYVVKISDYPLMRGFKALQGWNGNAGTIDLAQIYLSKEAPVKYVPSGKYILIGETPGSASLEAALADNMATVYDAKAVTGDNVTLTPANPNALFLANEGVLANSENVIVNGVCSNLELTDQQPFNAPADFTATSASLTKTIGAAGYATMVLPFDAALPEGVKAINIDGNNGNVLTTSVATTITANKPVMLKNAGTYTFTAENATIVAADGVQVNGLLNGVYDTTDVPTANGYVLQKLDDGVNFYKAVEGSKVNAFRAYLTTNVAAARLLFDFDEEDNEVTAIARPAAQSVAQSAFFNLNGQQVKQPAHGIFIMRSADGRMQGKKIVK